LTSFRPAHPSFLFLLLARVMALSCRTRLMREYSLLPCLRCFSRPAQQQRQWQQQQEFSPFGLLASHLVRRSLSTRVATTPPSLTRSHSQCTHTSEPSTDAPSTIARAIMTEYTKPSVRLLVCPVSPHSRSLEASSMGAICLPFWWISAQRRASEDWYARWVPEQHGLIFLLHPLSTHKVSRPSAASPPSPSCSMLSK
jgi:hypothetical protein